jgi:hypothetical protein
MEGLVTYHLANRPGHAHVITLDMRGTSYDMRGSSFDMRGTSYDVRGSSFDTRGTCFDVGIIIEGEPVTSNRPSPTSTCS